MKNVNPTAKRGKPPTAICAAASSRARKSPTSVEGQNVNTAVTIAPHTTAVNSAMHSVSFTRELSPSPKFKLMIGCADCAMAFHTMNKNGM